MVEVVEKLCVTLEEAGGGDLSPEGGEVGVEEDVKDFARICDVKIRYC